jgi:hypothetical protein
MVAAADTMSRLEFFGTVGIMAGAVLLVGSFKKVNVDPERTATLGMVGTVVVCFGTLATFWSSLSDYWSEHETETVIASLVILVAVVFTLLFTRARPGVRPPCCPKERQGEENAETREGDGF